MFRIPGLALAATLLATAAQAAVIQPTNVYEFSGSLDEASGGPAMTIGAGSSFTGSGDTQGLRFAADQGPTLAGGFANPEVYSLEMYFSLDTISSYRRLVDFRDGSEDGLYVNSGKLVFYPVTGAISAVTLTAGAMTHLVLTRDADQTFRAYIAGQQVLSFSDAGELSRFSGPTARFFQDNGAEASSGFVDFIRTYDRTLSVAEVGELYADGTPLRAFTSAAPEPGAWALMIVGFGGVGAMLRRRVRPALA